MNILLVVIYIGVIVCIVGIIQEVCDESKDN